MNGDVPDATCNYYFSLFTRYGVIRLSRIQQNKCYPIAETWFLVPNNSATGRMLEIIKEEQYLNIEVLVWLLCPNEDILGEKGF